MPCGAMPHTVPRQDNTHAPPPPLVGSLPLGRNEPTNLHASYLPIYLSVYLPLSIHVSGCLCPASRLTRTINPSIYLCMLVFFVVLSYLHVFYL